MLSASLRVVRSCCAAGLVSVVAVGCGDNGGSDAVPADGVAKVGDTVVTKAAFKTQFGTVTAGRPGERSLVYKPPGFSRCVAAKQGQPSTEKGKAKPSVGALRKQCKAEYERGKTSAMQILLLAEWAEQEARRDGVHLSDAEVRKSFESVKRGVFPSEQAYQQKLRTSHATEAAFLAQVRQGLLFQKLSDRAGKAAAKRPSERKITAYYERNKATFKTPPTRDIRLILTKKKADAVAARRALDGGASWLTAVDRYAMNKSREHRDGKVKGYQASGTYKDLDTAIFGTPPGVLKGPLHTELGWYVFEVEKVHPPVQRSLAQSRTQIANGMQSAAQQRAVQRFTKSFRTRYRDLTTCADAFKVAECKNGPAKNPTPPSFDPGATQ